MVASSNTNRQRCSKKGYEITFEQQSFINYIADFKMI